MSYSDTKVSQRGSPFAESLTFAQLEARRQRRGYQ